MANDDFPRGLFPLRWPKVSGNWYRVSTAADLYIGMPVDLASTGYVGPVNINTQGAVTILGAVMAFAGPQKSGLSNNDPFLDVSDITPPSGGLETGERYAFVTDDPNQEYIVQGDTGGTLATLSAAGECVALLYRTTSGNDNSGITSIEFDASTNVAQGSGQVTLMRLHETVNQDGTVNTAGANYQKWVARVTWHRKLSGNVDTGV